MPAERVSMRRVREILRLKHECGATDRANRAPAVERQPLIAEWRRRWRDARSDAKGATRRRSAVSEAACAGSTRNPSASISGATSRPRRRGSGRGRRYTESRCPRPGLDGPAPRGRPCHWAAGAKCGSSRKRSLPIAIYTIGDHSSRGPQDRRPHSNRGPLPADNARRDRGRRYCRQRNDADCRVGRRRSSAPASLRLRRPSELFSARSLQDAATRVQVGAHTNPAGADSAALGRSCRLRIAFVSISALASPS